VAEVIDKYIAVTIVLIIVILLLTSRHHYKHGR
jgi:hypothetical protein